VGSDLEQVATFVNGLPRFIILGKIQIDGLIADVAQRQIRHMGSHGGAFGKKPALMRGVVSAR
jgi:hypothetical protein